jgi:competence ComEA-like helix-hairpin-helix protein
MTRYGLKCAAFFMLVLSLLGATYLAAQTPEKTKPQATAKTPLLKGKTVNINKATEAELVKNVPLITPELARKIVKYREDNGDFQTLEELLQVEGFNRDLLRRIKPFLILEGIGGKDCTC